MATIVLTGGGTAGHVIPNLALLPELRKFFNNIHYIGGNGIEKELVAVENIPFHSTPTIKFDRQNIFNNCKIPFILSKGIKEAKSLLSFLHPDVVFSKGGYASLPTCFAAKSLNIPIVIHESDYSLGLANKITSKFASRVLTSFPETPGVYVGNPIRDSIFNGNKQSIIDEYKLDKTRKTILITGGSQGAQAINEVIYKSLPLLTERYNVLHICGKSGDMKVNMPYYHQVRYVNNINDYFACCELVVCRGGANTLNEVAALGLRALIIPLPKGSSRGDQLDNAKSFRKNNPMDILPQEELCVESLLYKISEMLKKPAMQKKTNNVNEAIVKSILDVIKK